MKPRNLLFPLLLLALPFAPFTQDTPAQGTPGDGTIPGVGEPGGPATDLPPAELAQWLRGRAVFDHAFHRSEGLGAFEMNADSCRGCHRDPALGGAGPLEFNVSRFGRDQLGTGPFENLPGGQGLSKLFPPFVAGREECSDEADVFEQRQTPSVLGDGFIDTLSDAEILAREDPLDLDGDGVKGVARRLTIDGQTEIGRFGWKGQVPHLRDFAKDAMGGELGITTPDDSRGFAMQSDIDAVADPELTEAQIDDMTFFMVNLAAPRRVGSLDPQVTAGELLFEQIGCAKCHVPELQGPSGPVRAFTDVLLHDVMPDNFRGMEEPGAAAGVFLTQPLWGIRHTAPYLHDGRGEDLDGAILAHHGEAQDIRDAYDALAQIDKDALIAFLNDL